MTITSPVLCRYRRQARLFKQNWDHQHSVREGDWVCDVTKLMPMIWRAQNSSIWRTSPCSLAKKMTSFLLALWHCQSVIEQLVIDQLVLAPLTSVIDLHKDTNMHYLSDGRKFHTLNQVVKCLNDLAPNNITSQLSLVKEQHTRNTRQASSMKLHVPHMRLEMSKKPFWYRGPQLWNLLDDDVTCIDWIHSNGQS